MILLFECSGCGLRTQVASDISGDAHNDFDLGSDCEGLLVRVEEPALEVISEEPFEPLSESALEVVDEAPYMLDDFDGMVVGVDAAAEEGYSDASVPLSEIFPPEPTEEDIAEAEATVAQELNEILPDFDTLSAGENVAKETVVLELHIRRPGFRKSFDSRTVLGSGESIAEDPADGKVKTVDTEFIHVSKDIIDRAEVKAINQRLRVLTTYMRSRCVPSKILAPGLYLLPIKFIQEMDAAIDQCQSDLQLLLDTFGQRYDAIVQNAKTSLGPFFRQEDYPPFQALRAQWRIDAQYRSLNVPAVLQSVNKELFKREQAKVKAQWADTAQEVRDALRAGFTKLVTDFSSCLGRDDEGKLKVFQKSRVEKLRDFLSTFEVRDLTSDTELAQLASEARQLLDGVDPQALRKNDALRTETEAAFTKLAEDAKNLVVVRERAATLDEDEL